MRKLVPVDIEGAGVRRSRSPFEHVEPPWIVGELHTDMVGDEVEDQSEAMRTQRVRQQHKACLAAKLRIEPGMIDNIVAVRRAPSCHHEGRGIEMRDAERLEVWNDF